MLPSCSLQVLPLMLWVVGSLGYLGVGVAGPRGGSLKGALLRRCVQRSFCFQASQVAVAL